MIPSSTHHVTNQTPSLAGGNAFRADPFLMQIAAGSAEAVLQELDAIGKFALSSDGLDLARLANENPPALETHDSQGNRINQIEIHPAFHALMRKSVSWGLCGSVWEDAARGTGEGHFQRACRLFLLAGLDAGHTLLAGSTNASVAALMAEPELARRWAPAIVSRKYDSSARAIRQKTAVTLALAVAEKQAGADPRAVSSRAESDGGGDYRITGHKWHVSAPASDGIIMLARAAGGLSAFLVPRFDPAGEPNRIAIMRMKRQAGMRSLPAGEIEMQAASASIIGGEGDGLRIIAEMATLMRLDSAVMAAALMHACLREAVHHARHRAVGGKPLFDEPLMQRVLCDVLLDVAAAKALAFRLARAYDKARSDDRAAAYAHVMTPAAAYWTAKVAPAAIAETVEACGGGAFASASPVARMLADAHALALWPGTGSRMALELVRIVRQMPSLVESVIDDIAADLGDRAAATAEVLRAAFRLSETDDGAARLVAEQLAFAGAAAELNRLGMGVLAEAFAASRLSGQWRSSYGATGARPDAATLLNALYPPVA